MNFIKKIIKAIKEEVLVYRIKRYFELKFFLRKKIYDFNLQIHEEGIFFNLLDNFKINSILQIGIGDPDLNRDPIYKYLNQRKISGTVVEPHPNLFKKLDKYYKNFLKLDCIISEMNNTEREFFFVDEKYLNEYEDYVKTISTVNKKHLIKCKVLPKHIIQKKIVSKTIQQIIIEYKIKSFELLFIDTEGSDLNIIVSFLKKTNFYPCIIFEWRHIDEKKLIDLLEDMEINYSYKFIFFQSDVLCFTEKNYKN